MKKSILLASVLAMSLWAVDYSQMTTQQLIELRGSVPIEDRDAFRAEMQSRMQTMTAEEIAAFRASRQATGMRMNQAGNQGANIPTFAQFDTDGDGKISEAELEAARSARIKAQAADGRLLKNVDNAPSFSTLDANGDGFIDASEFQTQQQMHMQSRMQNMQSKGMRQGSQGMLQNTQSIQQRVQDGSAAGQMLRGAGRGHGRP